MGYEQFPEHNQVDDTVYNGSSLTVVKQAARKKALRAAVWVMAFGLVPIAVLMSLTKFAETVQDKPETTNLTSLDVNRSQGKAAATLTVEDWMRAKPSPLPGGKVLSWDGFSVKPAPKFTAEQKRRLNGTIPTYREETHSFTVADEAGHLYDLKQLILVDDHHVVKPSGTPTLLPRPGESENVTAERTWQGYTHVEASEETETAISEWARAFTSGSAKTLKSVVGDPNKKRSYMPLIGVTKSKVSLQESAAIILKDKDGKEIPPNRILARVELMLQWEDGPKLSDAKNPAPATYDLLIDGVQTANPRVVAWGSAGEGPGLRKYSSSLTHTHIPEPDEIEQDEDSNSDDGNTDEKPVKKKS